jgi:hypothetical protein
LLFIVYKKSYGKFIINLIKIYSKSKLITMKPQSFLYVLFFLFFSFASCKKHKTDTPVDQLPPATQEGKHTLGFLLNGEPWTPKGWSGGTTNLSLYYDPSYHGGTFNITTYRQLSQDDKQTFGIATDSFQAVGTFFLNHNSNLKVGFDDRIKSCTITPFDTSIYREGKLVITKFDKINQIISGTFDFKLFNSNCGDTIKITNGRFDMKF